MKKYIIAATAALLAAVPAFSEVINYHFLQVNLNDGNTVQYKFSQQPTATFSGADMILALNDAPSVTYPMSEISSLTMIDDPTGVNEINGENGKLLISVTSEAVTVEGLAPGASLQLFDMSGRLVASAKASADGVASAALSSLQKGVFVAVTPVHSFKFINK